ncbi:MAG: tripartite tricarboxylate transporter TctB family protein [Pseudomonadota bacterium]
MNNPDRLSGLFFLLLGLGFYTVLIPISVEEADFGNISPETMPNIVAVIMAIAGAVLIIRPSSHELHGGSQFLRAGLFAVVLVVGVLALMRFSFLIAAPVLSLVIMLLIGERRPLWLLLGGVVMPTVNWVLVTQVLGRSIS